MLTILLSEEQTVELLEFKKMQFLFECMISGFCRGVGCLFRVKTRHRLAQAVHVSGQLVPNSMTDGLTLVDGT
jgi:hypothetical protein